MAKEGFENIDLSDFNKTVEEIEKQEQQETNLGGHGDPNKGPNKGDPFNPNIDNPADFIPNVIKEGNYPPRKSIADEASFDVKQKRLNNLLAELKYQIYFQKSKYM